MIRIIDNTISIPHGDDGGIKPVIKIGGTVYEMEPGDTLTLTVRERPIPESPILLQVVSDEPIIPISHILTNEIPVGVYSCDIQLTRVNGDIHTVYPLRDGKDRYNEKNYKNFIVESEVTTNGSGN